LLCFPIGSTGYEQGVLRLWDTVSIEAGHNG
jgi:hypothetical protein